MWTAAVARAQSTGTVRGPLPRTDDRPLYWTRLQVTAALRQWRPAGGLADARREAIIETFERASRGMSDISYPAGYGTARVLVSGFDPYTLDGGDSGTAPGAAGNNIRHGNPSGATALAIDGTTHIGRDGRRQVIHRPGNIGVADASLWDDIADHYERTGEALPASTATREDRRR